MLALIAGQGALPGILLDHLGGQKVMLCEMMGFPAQVHEKIARHPFRIETLGTLLSDLHARGVAEVCFAGAVSRPVVDPAAIDIATMPLVPRLMAAMRQGDDGTLREVLAIFEEAGFVIRAAHEIAPALLPAAGVPSRAQPDDALRQDALRAEAIVRAMATADIGQACVVRAGQALAVEAGPGTDWMLASLSPAPAAPPVPTAPQAETQELPQEPPQAPARSGGDPLLWAVDTASEVVGGWADWLGGPQVAQPSSQAPAKPAPPLETPIASGAMFFKAPKPAQDRRVDLPTIGPATVFGAVQAGLRAIVVEAGGVMILDLAQVVRIADAHGLVLWVRPAGAG